MLQSDRWATVSSSTAHQVTLPFSQCQYFSQRNPFALNLAHQLKFHYYETRRHPHCCLTFPFPRCGHILDLLHSTEALSASGCNTLYRCISSASALKKKRRFLLIWATSHPHYKEQPFPITGLRCAALSIYGLGHSTTQMTLQLLRWKRYKAEKGPIHLSSTRKCSTRSTSDPRANSGTRKRRAEKDRFHKKKIWRFLRRNGVN